MEGVRKDVNSFLRKMKDAWDKCSSFLLPCGDHKHGWLAVVHQHREPPCIELLDSMATRGKLKKQMVHVGNIFDCV